MATRFYFSSTAVPPNSPGFAAWTRTTEAVRRKMSTTKDASAMTNFSVWANTNPAANDSALTCQFQSLHLAVGTVFTSGVTTVKCYIRCQESATNDNINRQPICIKVYNGTTLQATILSLGHIGPNTTEWVASPTAATSKTLADGDTLTGTYTTVEGDYLVVEVGQQVSSAGGTSVTGVQVFGSDSATDIAENETVTAANNPWVEFSNTFATGAVIAGALSPTLRITSSENAKYLSGVSESSSLRITSSPTPSKYGEIQFAACASATEGFELFTTTSGTVTVDTTVKRGTNAASFKLNTSSPAVGALLEKDDIMADAGRRCSFWCNVPSVSPDADFPLLAIRTSGGTAVVRAWLTTAGKLKLEGVGATVVTGTSTVNINTWFRLAVSYTIASTTSFELRLYLNGVSEISISSNGTLTSTGTSQFLPQANVNAGINFIIYMDEFYIDNGTDLDDPGNIAITPKLYGANYTNQWDTIVGSNTLQFYTWADETGDLTKWTTTNGDASYSIAVKLHSHAGSYKLNTNSPAVAAFLRKAGVLAAAGRRISCWVNFQTLPAANINFIGCLISSGAAAVCSATIKTNGTLAISPSGASVVGGTTVLSTNTWYRIGFSYTITNSTTYEMRLYLNGNLEVSVSSNGTLSQIAPDILRLNIDTTAGTNIIFYFDEPYIDNGTDLADIGERFNKVNELPLDITDGWKHAASTDAQENYILQPQSEGDTNLTNLRKKGYTSWVYAKSASAGAGTPKIMNNGTETAITLTTSAAMYTVNSEGDTYPTGPFGMRSNFNAADTFFYEGGALIIYYEPYPVSESPTLRITSSEDAKYITNAIEQDILRITSSESAKSLLIGQENDTLRINSSENASSIISVSENGTIRIISAEEAISILYGVQFDSASNSGYQSPSSNYSWNHTWNGINRCLSVDITILSVPGTIVNSVTYNGANLTFIGAQSTVSGAGRVESWRILSSDSGAPDIGTYSIEVTLSASVASAGIAVSRYGVNQTTPIEAFNSNQATNVGATDATVDITSVTNKCVIHSAIATDDTSITANQTSRNNVTGALGSGGNEDTGPITPAGLTTMSYTNVDALATWAIVGYAILPLSAGTIFFGNINNLLSIISNKNANALLTYSESNSLLKLFNYGVQGPLSPLSTSVYGDTPGTITWNNFNNAKVEDNLYASSTLLFGEVSQHLETNNHGFSIPSDAKITGIQVDIKRRSNSLGITDNEIRLHQTNNQITGNNKATAIVWPILASYATYGGPTDLWGKTNWTPTIINGAFFGLMMEATAATADDIAQVDHVRITVYYQFLWNIIASGRESDNLRITSTESTNVISKATIPETLRITSSENVNLIAKGVISEILRITSQEQVNTILKGEESANLTISSSENFNSILGGGFNSTLEIDSLNSAVKTLTGQLNGILRISETEIANLIASASELTLQEINSLIDATKLGSSGQILIANLNLLLAITYNNIAVKIAKINSGLSLLISSANSLTRVTIGQVTELLRISSSETASKVSSGSLTTSQRITEALSGVKVCKGGSTASLEINLTPQIIKLLKGNISGELNINSQQAAIKVLTVSELAQLRITDVESAVKIIAVLEAAQLRISEAANSVKIASGQSSGSLRINSQIAFAKTLVAQLSGLCQVNSSFQSLLSKFASAILQLKINSAIAATCLKPFDSSFNVNLNNNISFVKIAIANLTEQLRLLLNLDTDIFATIGKTNLLLEVIIARHMIEELQITSNIEESLILARNILADLQLDINEQSNSVISNVIEANVQI